MRHRCCFFFLTGSDKVPCPVAEDVDDGDEEAASAGNIVVDEIDEIGDDIGVSRLNHIVASGIFARAVAAGIGRQIERIRDVSGVGLDGGVVGRLIDCTSVC